jgi:copper homeostasis protein (lipoprotein)
MRKPMVLVALGLLACCGPGSGDDHVEPGEPRAGLVGVQLPDPGTLPSLSAPAAWQGDLPCADCAGIRTLLVLRPDGTYGRQMGYLGLAPEADTLFGEMGRWVLDPDRRRIALHGSGEGTGWFSPREDGSVRMLDREGQEIESTLPYSLSLLGSVPELMPPLRMTGAFTYMADAALFVECNSGIQLPVAMTEGYLPLEQAYMEWRAEPLDPMLVRVRGWVQEHPAMEGDGTEEVLVVESFQVGDQEVLCPALEVREALAEGEWRLLSLHGEELGRQGLPGEVPTLQWEPGEWRLSGSGGCNRYTARGFLRGTFLVTEEVAVTRMFCEGAMELETGFLEVVAAGGPLRMEYGALLLFHGPKEVARFGRR